MTTSVVVIASVSAAVVSILLAIIASTAICIAVHRRKKVTTEHIIYEAVEDHRAEGIRTNQVITQSNELPCHLQEHCL